MRRDDLARLSHVTLAVGALVGVAFVGVEGGAGSDGPLATPGFALFAALPYAVAAGITRAARRSPSAMVWLTAVWVSGTLLSAWTLVDQVVLAPAFRSGIWVFLLPALGLPAVGVAGVVAWLLARRDLHTAG